MNGGPLSGRTALVTGAGGGIGRGIAIALGRLGANVSCAVRRAETGHETADLVVAAGGAALCCTGDISVAASVESAISATVGRFGGVDIIIHNAASGLSSQAMTPDTATEEDWDAQSAVALDAAFHLARAGFGPLAASGQGCFILLGSAQGLHGSARNVAYTALKGAQRGFVRALAQEWGRHGIRVNGVAPVALSDGAKAHFARNPDLLAATSTRFPLGRLGDPCEDVGVAVAALCSDAFAYVTGQMLCVDGGLYMAQ